MVHADYARFGGGGDGGDDDGGISKAAGYAQVHAALAALVADERNWVCATANAASLLWHLFHALPAPARAVNWAGFYVRDARQPDRLILGPFMGRVACQSIALGRGVCGSVAAAGTTAVVPDVAAFPGHIACDADTRSEIVVPIVVDGGRVVGVIDVDCAQPHGFDDEDRAGLERVASLLAAACDW